MVRALAAAVVLLAGCATQAPTASPSAIAPSATVAAAACPSPNASSAAVAPAEEETTIVRGWPGARDNPAGRYSYPIGTRKWMHNVSGQSGGVSLTFTHSIGRYECGPTAVMVAGYEGTFQEFPIDALGQKHVWIADIGGSTVAITLEVEPDTPAAMVAEAHAIIESLRREPDGDGFMLTFTLPEGWDSG